MARKQLFDRRRALLCLASVACGTSAAAQSSDPRRIAEEFVMGLMAASAAGDPDAVVAFLSRNADLDYVFARGFSRAALTGGQRERLRGVMLRFIAMEVIEVMRIARQGELRTGGARETEHGTEVSMEFRDAAGPFPVSILVGRNRGNVLQVRDIGSPQRSSVIGRLVYATEALALASPDPEVWIAAFAEAVR